MWTFLNVDWESSVSVSRYEKRERQIVGSRNSGDSSRDWVLSSILVSLRVQSRWVYGRLSWSGDVDTENGTAHNSILKTVPWQTGDRAGELFFNILWFYVFTKPSNVLYVVDNIYHLKAALSCAAPTTKHTTIYSAVRYVVRVSVRTYWEAGVVRNPSSYLFGP